MLTFVINQSPQPNQSCMLRLHLSSYVMLACELSLEAMRVVMVLYKFMDDKLFIFQYKGNSCFAISSSLSSMLANKNISFVCHLMPFLATNKPAWSNSTIFLSLVHVSFSNSEAGFCTIFNPKLPSYIHTIKFHTNP